MERTDKYFFSFSDSSASLPSNEESAIQTNSLLSQTPEEHLIIKQFELVENSNSSKHHPILRLIDTTAVEKRRLLPSLSEKLSKFSQRRNKTFLVISKLNMRIL